MVLRLTLGALAEMSEVTGAHSPFALAAVIKAGQPENITAIVKACLRPLNGAVDINNAQAREIFSRLSPVFVQAFEQAFNLEPRP